MTGPLAAVGSAWRRPAVRGVRPGVAVAATAASLLRLVPDAEPGARVVVVVLAALAAALALVGPVRRGASLRATVPAGERPAAALVLVAVALAAAVVFGGAGLDALVRRQGSVAAAVAVVVVAGVVALRFRGRTWGAAAGEPPGPDVAVGATGAAAPHRPAPLLEVAGLEVAYGRLQVLHGTTLCVGPGELVALLGVNGAGKSTVLRAVSGLVAPTAGTVTYDGVDITYLDAEARVRAGVVQVPGGRATFPGLSVLDNLRAASYAVPRAEEAERIEAVLAAFPRLAERRHQTASTLSGGEQQMLALAKALLLRPRVLLIDELSLGLAPVVVAELVQLVRRLRDEGTAVLLVEQSVNLALELADHAYFLERGTVGFDGPAAGLRERDDLLRAVFLQGVAR